MASKSGDAAAEDHSKGCCYYILYMASLILILLTLPVSICMVIKIVAEYERAVILRVGRVQGASGPGMFFVIPCLDEVKTVDLRTVSFDIPPQEILTKDSVTVAVDAVVFYRIFRPILSVTGVENAAYATKLLAQTTLRNMLGTQSLSGILQDREVISHEMLAILDEATDAWGIKVERVELKDVRLPPQLQRAMAAEAEASREAKAKIIAAQGEKDASLALREASDIINQSPGALQLRFLQTLTQVSAEKNSTVIFPLPIELLEKMKGK